MENSKEHKPLMPKNGRKVNDWETLRPYVEKAAPPKDVYLENIPSGGARFFSEPNTGYNKTGEETFLSEIEPNDGNDR